MADEVPEVVVQLPLPDEEVVIPLETVGDELEVGIAYFSAMGEGGGGSGIPETTIRAWDAEVLDQAHTYADQLYIDLGNEIDNLTPTVQRVDQLSSSNEYRILELRGRVDNLVIPTVDVTKAYVDAADTALGQRITDITPASIGAALASHTHTKAQVGLGNVDNTTDLGKPVSTATQAALDLKSDTGHTHPTSDIIGLPATPTWSTLSGKPTTFPPEAHSHTFDSIMERPTAYPPSTHQHAVADIMDMPVISRPVDIQTFTPTGAFSTATQYTWVKPEGAKIVQVMMISAGGGGGQGGSNVLGSTVGGGGGGGAGNEGNFTIPADQLPGTVSVSVPKGGRGGIGGTTNSWPLNTQAARFGDNLVNSGSPGAPGSPTGNNSAGGGAWGAGVFIQSPNGGAGANDARYPGQGGGSSNLVVQSTGGGGGSGLSSNNNFSNAQGGIPGNSWAATNNPKVGVTGDGANGEHGTRFGTNMHGTGGGGGTGGLTKQGGRGGDGATYGGGGGGGGGGRNDLGGGGDGGNGGDGIVIVTTYF